MSLEISSTLLHLNTPPPKISVLMCVYNDSQYLRQAIDSILNQTFTDFEFIIIDDASTEDIASIIFSYNDTRIVFKRLEKNQGLPGALNVGLDMCRGEYIARMDSDDVSVKSRLQLLLDGFKNNKIGLVSCYSISVTGNLERRKSVWHDETIRLSKAYIKKTMPQRNCIVGAGAMYSRKVLMRVGYYDQQVKSCEDYNYYLRILQFFDFEIVPKTLYFARYNAKSYRRTTEYRKHNWPEIARTCAIKVPCIVSRCVPTTITEQWWQKKYNIWMRDKTHDLPKLAAKSAYALIDTVFNFLLPGWINCEDVSILDVGTGDGRVVRYLKDVLGYTNVHGLDHSIGMLSRVPEDFPSKNLIMGNVRSLSKLFPKFDVVFTCGTLTHIHPAHLLIALKNITDHATQYAIHVEHVPTEETFFYSESHGGCWRHNIVKMYENLGKYCKVLTQRRGKYAVYIVDLKGRNV